MKAFTSEEYADLQSVCHSRFDEMLRNYKWWFSDMAGLSTRSREAGYVRTVQLISDFRQLVKELTENVAYHAHGLGYMMMELDPRIGLSIYVGDTGIGLARGLSRAYQVRIRSDTEAVGIVLKLKDLKHKRRRLPGTLTSGGRGLERVSLILQDMAGLVWIRTRRAMAVFTPGKSRDPQELKRELFNVQGTHVHILIPSRQRQTD